MYYEKQGLHTITWCMYRQNSWSLSSVVVGIYSRREPLTLTRKARLRCIFSLVCLSLKSSFLFFFILSSFLLSFLSSSILSFFRSLVSSRLSLLVRSCHFFRFCLVFSHLSFLFRVNLFLSVSRILSSFMSISLDSLSLVCVCSCPSSLLLLVCVFIPLLDCVPNEETFFLARAHTQHQEAPHPR